MRRYDIMIGVSVLLLFGCAGKKLVPGTEKCIQNCAKPGWVNHPKEKSNKEQKAFVGHSFKHSTERQALDYAKTNAWEEALTSMWGVYGKEKIREIATNAGVSAAEIIDDAIVRETMTEWKQEGRVKGYFTENHIEQWEKVGEAGDISGYYVAHRLFMVSREVIKEFLTDALLRKKVEEANEQTRKNIERALELLKKMETRDFEAW